jgi:hypothetical protein
VLRQYLEPRTDTLLEAINKELLEPAIKELKQQGKQGLVVIVDNLDRIDNSPKPGNRTQPEYLFVDRGRAAETAEVPCGLYDSTGVDVLERFGGAEKSLWGKPQGVADGAAAITGWG